MSDETVEHAAGLVDAAGDESNRPEPDPSERFSMMRGGPFYRLLLRTHLVGPALEHVPRRILALIALTWLPPALLSALSGDFAGGAGVPFLHDLRTFQLLISMPMLVAAEPVVHRHIQELVHEFPARDLLAPNDRPRFEGIVGRAIRMCDSTAAEGILLVISVTLGYWVWRTYPTLHVAAWYSDAGGALRAAGGWYAFVSLPVARFLILRWYFRLFVWYVLLLRVSRLRLRLNALHADRAGGIGFLQDSCVAFAAPLVAQSSFLALVAGNQIWHEGVSLLHFKVVIVGFVLLLVASAIVPLTFFVAQLLRTWLDGGLAYGQFASRHANAFRGRWLGPKTPPDDTLVGTSDISSLADLGTSYEVVHTMRFMPLDKEALLRLVVLVVAPLLPLAFTLVDMEKALHTVVRLLV